jgi:hypothetical protein
VLWFPGAMSVRWLSLLALLAAFAWILLRVAASRILFRVRAAGGKVVSAHGRAPGELLHDVADILRRHRATGFVTVRLRDGRARVYAVGLPPDAEQQIRNVVGRFPLARLRSAPMIRERR